MIGRKRNSAHSIHGKQQNNPLPLFLSPKTRASYIKQTGDASRSLERDPPMTARRDATPSTLPSTLSLPPNPTDSLSLPIFSVELIRSMRAPGRAARHAGTVSICEPTQTGSPGVRLVRVHMYAFLYACTHTYANVSPPTGWRTPTRSVGGIFLPRSFVRQTRSPPSLYYFLPLLLLPVSPSRAR